MKAEEKPLIRFLEGHDKRFIIPVYQRNYDWNREQCQQLFNDLVDMVQEERKSHFFGSVVHLFNDGNNGIESIVIDGQQRITTVSLLLLALAHLLEKNEIKDENINIDEIKNEYLLGKYNQQEKIKLKPIKDDNHAFEKLFKGDKRSFLASNITNNYLFFKEEIKNMKIAPSLLFKAIKGLDIVEIKLRKDEDDPQLIFESLNSTGLDLSEADKVRNFILMGLDAKTQEEYYEKYWNVIEKNTEYDVSNFIRDYLTLKERKIPNKSRVYISFKKHFIEKYSRGNLEDLLADLEEYSGYYKIIKFAKHKDNQVNKALARLNKLDVTVAYPFLLDVFNEERNERFDDKGILEILNIIEAFVFRRVLCDVPTNALNKVFMILAREIKNNDDWKNNYIEILKYILKKKEGSQRFPDDKELAEKLLIKDIYNLQSKNKLHVLENLENHHNKEKIDLENLLNENTITIEHIMPRTLTPKWKESLGENYQQIHDKYINTIGNLTLTAYNSEMSNKSFKEKQSINGGFNDSKMFLNKYLTEIDEWNEEHILRRAKKLIKRVLSIWPYPETNYVSKKDILSEYSLDDDYSFSNKKIGGFIFMGETYEVSSWRDFYKKVNQLVFDLKATKYEKFMEDENFTIKMRASRNENDLIKAFKLTENIYIECNMSADSIVNNIKKLFEYMEMDLSDISVTLAE